MRIAHLGALIYAAPTCKLIGTAAESIEEGSMLGSFNAG